MEPLVSAYRQQFFDLCNQPAVFGFNGAFEGGDLLAGFIDEILVKIPLGRLSGARR